jgi:hypothetical protein
MDTKDDGPITAPMILEVVLRWRTLLLLSKACTGVAAIATERASAENDMSGGRREE